MKLHELVDYLQKLKREGHGDKEVDVLIETPKDLKYQCQYQFPLNDIATTKNKIVLMHEEW